MLRLAAKILKPKGCVHHYMLPEPSGVNEVVGVCKKCGDEKVHELVIPWTVWNTWRGDPKKAKKAKKASEAKKKKEAMSAGAAEKHRREYSRVYRSKKKEGENGKRPK